jgi:hypothetical protein
MVQFNSSQFFKLFILFVLTNYVFYRFIILCRFLLVCFNMMYFSN